MAENKQAILDALLVALKLTREYEHVESLRYESESPNKQIVRVTSKTACERVINVTYDSGSAMVRDVIRQLERM